MTITDEDVRRFQEIWRQEFKEEISDDEARRHINRLDALYLMLAKRPLVKPDVLPGQSDEKPEDRRIGFL